MNVELHQGHAQLHAERRSAGDEVDGQQHEPQRRPGMGALGERSERVGDPARGTNQWRMGEEAGDVKLGLGHVAGGVPRLPG